MLRRRARHRNADRAGLAGRIGWLGAALVLVAGCGGEDEDEFPAGVAQPQTKVEFLREADRICHSGDARIEAAADDLVGAAANRRRPRSGGWRSGSSFPRWRRRCGRSRSLPVAPGDEAEVEAIIDATERGIAEIEADPAGLVDGPPPGLREAGRLGSALRLSAVRRRLK